MQDLNFSLKLLFFFLTKVEELSYCAFRYLTKLPEDRCCEFEPFMHPFPYLEDVCPRCSLLGAV